MRTISNFNFHVARAMLNTIENLHILLIHANSINYLITEIDKSCLLVEIQKSLCKNLARLLEHAQNHVKNLEITLIEEMDMVAELESAD